MPFAACSVQVVCLVVFRRCFYSRFSAQHVSKQSNQVSRVQYCVFADFCLCQSRNCPHNCSTFLCVTSYVTLPSFSIVSSGSTLASSSSASQPVHSSLQTSMATVQSRQAPAVGPGWRHIHVRLIRSRRAVVVPLTPQIPQSPPLFIGKSMRPDKRPGEAASEPREWVGTLDYLN